MRILTIDYGMRRVGLAISDPLGMLASPLKTLETTGRGTLLDTLLQIIQDERVERVVFGLTRQRDGEFGPVARAALSLAWEMHGRSLVPVTWMDEAYSSAEAALRLKSIGGKRRSPQEERKIIDQVAATLLLEEYLLSVPETPLPLPALPQTSLGEPRKA